MRHRSRLAAMVIDCKVDDLADATAFWSGALGGRGEIDPAGRYATIETQGDQPQILLQAVEHDPRVHLDIETDDIEAEIGRLEALGARRVADIKGWTVMQAPTGHRFCVVKPQRADFAARAKPWDDA